MVGHSVPKTGRTKNSRLKLIFSYSTSARPTRKAERRKKERREETGKRFTSWIDNRISSEKINFNLESFIRPAFGATRATTLLLR